MNWPLLVVGLVFLWLVFGAVISQDVTEETPFRRDVTIAEILIYLPIYCIVGPFILLAELSIKAGSIKLLSWKPFDRK